MLAKILPLLRKYWPALAAMVMRKIQQNRANKRTR